MSARCRVVSAGWIASFYQTKQCFHLSLAQETEYVAALLAELPEELDLDNLVETTKAKFVNLVAFAKAW
jgi:hypothetical protein